MNTLVVLPAMNEILDSARILEAQGFKFTPEQVQALVTICLKAIAQDMEFIAEEVEHLSQDMLADMEPVSRRIN